MEIEFCDRYSVTGTTYPHGLTVCRGGCEGMGCYPVRMHDPDLTDYERSQIQRSIAERGPEGDRCYIIRCGACHGTRKCSRLETLRRIPGWLWKGLQFVWHTRRGGYYGPPYLPLRERISIVLRS